MSAKVTSRTGEEWDMGLERPPLLPRWRGSFRAGAESLEAGGWAMELAEIPAVGVVFLVIGVAIIGLSVVGFVLLPVLLFVVELVVLLIVALVVAPYRWLRGQHTVVARSKTQELRWRVSSVADARDAIDSAAASMEAGAEVPTPTTGELLS